MEQYVWLVVALVVALVAVTVLVVLALRARQRRNAVVIDRRRLVEPSSRDTST
ncbi:hypothetical protein [Ornithinimicrobium sediminis]|jgi:heme exporter protein D|uniref:hypothetical protein n=1 Tax=Ornithinimicrobium sediminis TaxID=2904603 RepID=UPI001E4D28DF|nr:hypothetical protein [Ornithinimicrobium sediminis]MCE0487930.1 hypothetical protein [Ornithinimicrobium sediminis]